VFETEKRDAKGKRRVINSSIDVFLGKKSIRLLENSSDFYNTSVKSGNKWLREYSSSKL